PAPQRCHPAQLRLRGDPIGRRERPCPDRPGDDLLRRPPRAHGEAVSAPASGAVDRPRPLACAHRGDSARERENTLPAIRSAIDYGADYVEIDVRLSADGQVVVLHDPTLA